MNDISSKPFQFKQFKIEQDRCTMKVGTDGVLLGAWANMHNAQKILDIGTGSGVIAIMLAQRSPQSIVHGVEIDPIACEQALQNMQASPWTHNLNIWNLSIQDFANFSEEKYDLIISNPPFFTGGTFSSNQDKNMVRHTIKLPHGDLLLATRKLLNTNGKFCVILPMLEGLRFIEVARNYHLYCTHMTEVRPKKEKGIERLLLMFEQEQTDMKVEELVIQIEKRNEFTAEYIALTKEFYVKM